MKKGSAGILFVAFLALYLLTMGGHLYSPDEEIMFLTTRALAEKGTLAIEPHDSLAGFATRESNGRLYAQYGVGQPLLAIPFYLLGRTLAGAMGNRPIGFTVLQYHGDTPREQWERFGVSLFNQVVAALLATLLFALAFDLTGDRRAALMTAVLYGAGTIAWVHSKPFFTETLATLCIFSSFALLVRARLYARPRWVTLAGIAAGYAVLVRLDSVVAYPGLGLLLLWPDPSTVESAPQNGNGRSALARAARTFDRTIRDPAAWQRIGRFAPPVVLACIIILGLNTVLYGSPLSTGYSDQPEGVKFINPLLVGLYGFFFSVGKGLFFFSPPLVLFFWSIRRFTRQWPPAAWALLAIVGCLILFHSKWINWAGGWCWGPRHIFMVHVFLALPICALLVAPRGRPIRIAYALLLVVGIGVQLYGTSQNFIDYYQVCFRDPFTRPTATAVYHPGEDTLLIDPGPNAPLPSRKLFEVRMNENKYRPETTIAPWEMVAPIGDSIWRIENSQWTMYAKMWAAGFHDYFWLERLGKRARIAPARQHLRELLGPPDKPDPPPSAAPTP